MLTTTEKRLIKQTFNTDKFEELSAINSMTNKNILIDVDRKLYILRRPGEGTNELVNRSNERQSYMILKPYNITDEIIVYDPDTSIKITKYIKNTHTCKPDNWAEVDLCMQHLRRFHKLKLSVPYKFDLFENINKYESLMGKSEYADYDEVKARVFELRRFTANESFSFCLTHIDPNQDNFLITKNDIRLIDWEYAAMQDPHVDIAMFAIYAGYNRMQLDKLIWCYFHEIVDNAMLYKIYAYVAICGLLWSNWCEYKKRLGVDFGDYAKQQFEYARTFSKVETWNV